MNTAPAVIVNIQRQPGANIIAVVDRITALLPQLHTALPPAVQMAILTDRTTTIRASVRDVKFELMLTIALVVMVIFLFLRTLSATVIPSVAVPLSLVATFGVMYLLGYSLNNLTLMALTIATGFVVDDAIVMLENITRYVEQGDAPMEAALKGSKQIGFTILSLTVSLIAVLIPLLFMGDIVGRLFRQFAVTLSATILVSAIVSLTLTPMMAARLLRRRDPSEEGRFYRQTERAFKSVLDFYARTLTWILRHQTATLVIAVVTLAVTILLYVVIPKGFFPVQDTGVIIGVSQAPETVSFPSMAERQQALIRIILQDDAVESLASFIGVDAVNTTLNTGRVQINLKPLEERGIDALGVIRRLQPALAQVEGITLFMQPVQDLTVESTPTRTQFQYTLEHSDRAELARWVARLVARLQQLPMLRDVASDETSRGLEARLVLDRSTAARLGIAPQLVDDTLYDAFGQRQISTMFTQLNQYRVVLETEPGFQHDPSDLTKVYVQPSVPAPSAALAAAPAPAGISARTTAAPAREPVPLSTFARLETTAVPLSINHLGQFPAVTVSFNLAPGASLGDAVAAVNRATEELGLPPSVRAGFQGTARAFEASLVNEPLLVLAALVTVYIVLGVLYESYIHPITILSTLPSAAVGALLALLLTRNAFTIIALIGIVLLIGIVEKNAIMMIDFALEAERSQGRAPQDAIYQAALLRFRPILMTTMSALLGGVPLALGTGTGSELRRPLGIVIVGGLIFSQLLTLYTTPVVYLAFDRLARRFTRTR
jgi:multidrug efflux pump